MDIATCYRQLPDKLLLAFKDATGCPDIDIPEDWAAVIPCVIVYRDRSIARLSIPALANPQDMHDRLCVFFGQNAPMRYSGVIVDMALVGPSMVVVVKITP